MSQTRPVEASAIAYRTRGVPSVRVFSVGLGRILSTFIVYQAERAGRWCSPLVMAIRYALNPVRVQGNKRATQRANDSGGRYMQRRSSRPPCGARTRTGTPCQGGKIPGRKRCRWHGGLSTGPRTAAGKQRALLNLVQFRTASRSSQAEQ